MKLDREKNCDRNRREEESRIVIAAFFVSQIIEGGGREAKKTNKLTSYFVWEVCSELKET